MRWEGKYGSFKRTLGSLFLVIVSMYSDLMGRGILFFQKYDREQGSLPYIGNFCVGLIFAEFATFLKSPKIDTGKNKPYYTSSLRVLEIVKIELCEYIKHKTPSKRHFRKKIPDAKNSRDAVFLVIVSMYLL